MEERKEITILGLGNVLVGDDGFGPYFIGWFSDRYELPDNVTLVDGGTAGLALLDVVTRSDHLIVVDAVKVDDEPGSLYRFTRQELPFYLPAGTSAHEVEFLDVLSMADLLGQCPPVVFIAVVPQKYDTMEVMISGPLVRRLPDVARLLLEELSALGVKPNRRPGCTS
jgi:hydrogenase maturation protease